MRNRRLGINIRVTENEKGIIEKNARKCSLTVSEYLRQIAMEHDPKEIPKAEIYDEMLRLQQQIDLLQDVLQKTNDPKLRQVLDLFGRETRKTLTNIWQLLLKNYEAGKGGGTHGND